MRVAAVVRDLTPQELDERVDMMRAMLASAPERCPVNRAFVDILEASGHLGAGDRTRRNAA